MRFKVFDVFSLNPATAAPLIVTAVVAAAGPTRAQDANQHLGNAAFVRAVEALQRLAPEEALSHLEEPLTQRDNGAAWHDARLLAARAALIAGEYELTLQYLHDLDTQSLGSFRWGSHPILLKSQEGGLNDWYCSRTQKTVSGTYGMGHGPAASASAQKKSRACVAPLPTVNRLHPRNVDTHGV